MRSCPVCGAEDIGKFCGNCGAVSPNEDPSVPAVSLDEQPENLQKRTSVVFWSRPTLIYLTAAVLLFSYTCVHFWS